MMDLLKEDVDRLLSYHTKQQVNILDKGVGLTNIFIQLSVVSYIIGYVFVLQKGYLAYEQAFGVATTSVSGDLLAMSAGTTAYRYFSTDELVYPPLENGNVFITTKLDTYEQTRKVCEDVTMPCATADDCSVGVDAKCSANGFCEEPGWCSDGQPESFSLDTGQFQVWIRSAIQFVVSQPEKIFGTSTHTAPILCELKFDKERDARVVEPADCNTFTVRKLLEFCTPPVRFEEVSELGAAIEVQLAYNCNVDGPPEDCVPTIRARRVDTLFDENDIGFTFAYPEYTSRTTRRLHDLRGIRFYVRTVGTGHFFSVPKSVMMMSTGIALLGFAPVLTDLIMLTFFHRSNKYRARKYEKSPDFSNLPEKDGAGGCCGGGDAVSESSDDL